ncbi:MAG: SDR family oxidoreductase [Gammaproteobacteria bacterium]
MDIGVRDKVALVAAASKGLGFGIAQVLAEEGAKVSIGSRTATDIKAAATQLQQQTKSEVLAGVLDAADHQSILDWVSATHKHFGRVDCLVINAGGPPAGNFDDFEDPTWQAAFELTLLSAVRMVRAVLPLMRQQGGGSILAVTSSSVKEPIDHLLLSNVMRSGVASLMKSLARQLAKENIRVNNLVPGRIDTERVRSLDAFNAKAHGIPEPEWQARMEATIPMGRYGHITEFGKAGAFLLSDAASYITGATFVVDGGLIRAVT